MSAWVYDRPAPEVCTVEVALEWPSGLTGTIRARFAHGQWEAADGQTIAGGPRAYAWRMLDEAPPKEPLIPPSVSLPGERHTPHPWSEDLAPPVPAGDSRVLLNGMPPQTAVRILSEANHREAVRLSMASVPPATPPFEGPSATTEKKGLPRCSFCGWQGLVARTHRFCPCCGAFIPRNPVTPIADALKEPEPPALVAHELEVWREGDTAEIEARPLAPGESAGMYAMVYRDDVAALLERLAESGPAAADRAKTALRGLVGVGR